MSTHLKSVLVLLGISSYLSAFGQVGTLNAVHQPEVVFSKMYMVFSEIFQYH